MKVKFSVIGYVVQTVEITKKNYSAAQLEKDLNSGKVVTTIQEGVTVYITKNGKVIGTVINVDNNCEYEDFEVENDD